MPGPKKSVPAPVDRPLQKAYLREFTGWSTAYPPGNSDPTSCRVMENVMIKRNGSIAVRPGLRYMSYLDTPDVDPVQNQLPGLAFDLPLVGSLEPFYLDGDVKVMLFAVRESDSSVGFRVLNTRRPDKTVLTLAEAGFYIPQGVTTLNFSSATKHVTYLQIDNKILVLSDAGEQMRFFSVGTEKVAKALNTITKPDWSDEDKPVVVHPQDEWISKLAYLVRRNELLNPSFEAGLSNWSKGSTTFWQVNRLRGRTADRNGLEVWTAPLRTNYAMSPLHNVSATGTAGWHSGKGDPVVDKDNDWMKVYDAKGKNVFLAHSAKCAGIEEGKRYKLAFDFDLSSDALLRARIQFYRNNGSEIGDPIKFSSDQRNGRWESPGIVAPNNAVSARIYLGADSTKKGASWAKFKHVMLCRANESTDFFSGNSGANYYWLDPAKPNACSSLYWPPQDITIVGTRVPVTPGQAVTGSIHVRTLAGSPRTVNLDCFAYDRDGRQITPASPAIGTATTDTNWQRVSATKAANASTVAAAIQVTIRAVAPYEVVVLDDGMIEASATLKPYFDGSSVSTTQTVYTWENPGMPHLSPSIETVTTDLDAIPLAQTPSADTLIATGGPDVNKYKMGFFYTFENEIGESAPSKITEVRMKRPQSNWLWKLPGTNGEPTGAETSVADLCADQLVAYIPQDAYTKALSEGAIRWNLYTFSWSDQEPVPVEASLAGSREIYPDEVARLSNQALPYLKGGWINVTPSRRFTVDSQPLPTATNRVNYSDPPKARNGIVAGDRVVVVGDPRSAATIKWTTNRPGDYTNFSAHKGGGSKTLSAGNLHLPVSVQLWQNPQSVDTLTILCLGSDGTSSCYYMSPADANTQSSAVSVMGFEETTNTPGTTSPFGVIVHNNALFRPIDRALLKSTAQNYNINHKTLSDDIANMWEELQFKNNIIAAEHDNRLYFLVNNPRGAALEDGCLGNEVWVYDVAGGEKGSWSRWLTQGSDLRIIEYGTMVYIGLIRPEGMYYFDPNARQDDYVALERDPVTLSLLDSTVRQRPIPWFFEMNTQGSNRARDAWAHLQQVSVMFGDFEGSVRYGIRGRTVHGKTLQLEKVFEDYTVDLDDGLRWDIEDHLLVRRDLKEWYFSAGSVDGKPSSGSIVFVQYRFTPTTVNVGYEYGSVETFEYTRDTGTQGSLYSTGGIPRPVQDRDWERT